MTIAYIRMYLALGIGHLSILELNDLQKEIDGMIQGRCDTLLAEASLQRLDDSQIGTERRLSHEC